MPPSTRCGSGSERLDRLGERGESWAVIVSRRDQVVKGAEDFVYGPSLGRTWSWLQGMAERPGGEGARGNPVVDMGVMFLPVPPATELLELLPPARRAPVLLPAHLDLWTQTAPLPLADPDPALFLHGPSTEPPDVSVVWRADLDGAPPDTWANIVALAPPSPPETISVPAYATRRWLTGAHEEEIADVEGAQVRPGEEIGQGKVILRWRGSGSDVTMPIGPAQVRPGDTIVVPASYGGADEFGWNPGSRQPVPDIAEVAFLSYRKRALLRLHPATLGPHVGGEETARQVRDQLGRLAIAIEQEDTKAPEKDLLEVMVGAEDVPAWLAEAAQALLRDPTRRRLPYPDRRGIVLLGSRRLRAEPEPGFSSDEGDQSSFTGAAVSLAAHCRGVADQARRFAAARGLPAGVVGDLELAASLHDLGKADPRFQVMLHRGDQVEAAIAEEALAKSGMDPRDRRGLGSAWAASELPRGYRHESTSLALLEAWPATLDEAKVPDLVRHLVAAHHGAARPFLPPIPDADLSVELWWGGALVQARTAHDLSSLDSGVSDRFWLLVRRYGWWGLAYLEAIVRLADQRRSQTEAEEGGWTS